MGVIRAARDGSDLDRAAILARIEDFTARQRLIANTGASVARGTFRSPTFFIGEEPRFGKDRLWDVEDAIATSA
jgi:2-hydroxychromene-2-carboxylate isomerase